MLLFVLPSLFAIASGLACFDNGDKEIGGSCYKFVSQQLSFNDARNWCHFQNPVTASYLAYVPNQFTGNFLASYARSAFGQNDGNFWIGLSRRNSSSPWTWDSGLPVVFTNFDGSQLGQNYAAESLVSTKWGTYGNDELKNFVCSYDPTAPPTFGPGTALPETTFRPSSRPIITTTAPNAPTTTDSPPRETEHNSAPRRRRENPVCSSCSPGNFTYLSSKSSRIHLNQAHPIVKNIFVARPERSFSRFSY